MTGAPVTRGRPRAVVIATDLIIISRHLEVIAEAERRGLVCLVVVGPQTPAGPLERHRTDADHPLSRPSEIVRVDDYELGTLLSVVTGWLKQYDVCAVLNCGELFVEAMGVLAQTLGLPGPGAHAARVSRNKVLQRLAMPHLAPAWSASQATAGRRFDPAGGPGYPAVLKPAGRMSSSGVVALADSDELRALLPRYEPGELLLVEERVAGAEFSVEALVQEGDIRWSGVTAKTTNETDTRYFTEVGHTSPAPTSAERLHQATRSLVESVGFGTGMLHAEFRLTGERAVLMEFAARPPGDAITRLWHLATGRPIEPVLLDLSLGAPAGLPAPRRRARQIYLDHPYGRLADVVCDEPVPVSWVTDDGAWPTPQPAEPDAPGRLCAVLVTAQAGDELGDAADSGGRAVSIVVDGPLDEDLEALAVRAAESVRIVVRQNQKVPAGGIG